MKASKLSHWLPVSLSYLSFVTQSINVLYDDQQKRYIKSLLFNFLIIRKAFSLEPEIPPIRLEAYLGPSWNYLQMTFKKYILNHFYIVFHITKKERKIVFVSLRLLSWEELLFYDCSMNFKKAFKKTLNSNSFKMNPLMRNSSSG